MIYWFSLDKIRGHKFGVKNINWDLFENAKKKIWIFFSIFKNGRSPASGKENVRFLDSPDFENLPDFRTGRDVRLSPTNWAYCLALEFRFILFKA